MRYSWFFGGAFLGLIAVLSLTAWNSDAATDKYKFVARAVVTAVDGDRKTITASVTHVTGKALNDLQGETKEFKASSAKIYKTAAGKEVRIKLTNVAIGDEILLKGAAKSDGTFALSWVHVNSRSFTTVGTLKEHNKTLKTLKLAVSSISYKPDSYKGKDVVVKYSSSTTFKSDGQSIESDDVSAGDQKVKVSGKIAGGNWEIDSYIGNYNGK